MVRRRRSVQVVEQRTIYLRKCYVIYETVWGDLERAPHWCAEWQLTILMYCIYGSWESISLYAWFCRTSCTWARQNDRGIMVDWRDAKHVWLMERGRQWQDAESEEEREGRILRQRETDRQRQRHWDWRRMKRDQQRWAALDSNSLNTFTFDTHLHTAYSCHLNGDFPLAVGTDSHKRVLLKLTPWQSSPV